MSALHQTSHALARPSVASKAPVSNENLRLRGGGALSSLVLLPDACESGLLDAREYFLLALSAGAHSSQA